MITTNLSLIVVIIVASVYLLFYQSSNKDFQGYYAESYDNEYQIDAIDMRLQDDEPTGNINRVSSLNISPSFS
jgi:hypothetical protein